MLRELKIENIAVIEKAQLGFTAGLNVLTGETGAGKSIVIDSLNAVLGERTSKELIRSGCDSAGVTAVFDDINATAAAALSQAGIEYEQGDELIISRTITSSGRNSCRVNGTPVTVTQLRSIGNTLVNIHGQHDGQALLDPDKHCSFIDSLAGNEALRKEYKEHFHSLVKVKKELDSLYDKRDEMLARADYLDFVIKEITDAAVTPGESEKLSAEKLFYQNKRSVQKSLEKAYSMLSGDRGLTESLAECASLIEEAAKFYDGASEPAKAVRGLALELADRTAELGTLTDEFNFSDSRISEIDSRLDEIYRLSMKYGKNEEEILQTLENSVRERELIGSCDERIASLEEELYKTSDTVKSLAAKLTATRKKAAEKFEKSVSGELAFLDMPNVVFKAEITPAPLSSKGAETIEFLISANPGQEPKPIAKTASGGELSRIMLAIKNVLSSADPVATLIFDEIDAGVSGSAAEKIALKLWAVSRGRQVICVTHLARIAAQADYHMLIEKSVRDGGTFTLVTPLDFEGRARELSRITAGSGVTELQIDSARELLAMVEEAKKK